MLIMAAAQGASSFAASRSANKRSEEERESQEQMTRQGVGYNESLQDPFRGQMTQAKDLSRLDMLMQMKDNPMSMEFGQVNAPGNPYAKYIPTFSGGPSAEKSPELVEWLRMLQRNIAGGNTMPTMTEPGNYGRSSAMDLVTAQAHPERDPATISWRDPRNLDPNGAVRRGPGVTRNRRRG